MSQSQRGRKPLGSVDEACPTHVAGERSRGVKYLPVTSRRTTIAGGAYHARALKRKR